MAWEVCPQCGKKVVLTNQHGGEYKWGKCRECGCIVEVNIKK